VLAARALRNDGSGLWLVRLPVDLLLRPAFVCDPFSSWVAFTGRIGEVDPDRVREPER